MKIRAIALIALFSGNSLAQEAPLNLSINKFTQLALESSLRSRTTEDTWASARYGWKADRRALTWPTLTASANESRTVSDTDTGIERDNRDHEGVLALTQPMLTGTEISAEGAWTDSRTDTDMLGATSTSKTKVRPDFSASVTQPIFLFVRNSSLRSKRQADLTLANDQDSYRRSRLSIEFDARSLYYTLLLKAATTEVERKKFESSNLVHRVTRALVRSGKLAEVELVRADIRSKRDLRRIQNAESDWEKTLNEAKDLVLIPADTEIKLVTKLRYRPLTIPENKLISAAEENNPDLQSAKRSIRLSELTLQSTKEGDRPRLATTGTYSRTRDRSDPFQPIDPWTWTVALGVEWPIFDGTQTRLRTYQGQRSLDTTKRAYEDQRRQLEIAVKNAVLELKRTEEQITDFEPQRRAAEQNVEAIRLQYRSGRTRLTDVFDAENEMRDLELEYLGLLISHNTARDRLKTLVGIDLEEIKAEN